MSDPALPAQRSRIWLTIGVILAFACLIVVLFRAAIATAVLRHVLAGPGTQSDIVVESVGLGGATAHGTLSQPGLKLSLGHVAVRWTWQGGRPHLTAITITQPTVVIDLRHGRATSQSGTGSLGDADISVSQARLIALTKAGRLELMGQARLAGGKPQLIDATLLPTHLQSGTLSTDLTSGHLTGTAAPHGMQVQFAANGNVSFGPRLRLEHAALHLDVPELTWTNQLAAAAPAATLSLNVAGRAPWSVAAQLLNFEADLSHGRVATTAAVHLKGSLPPDVTQDLLARVPLLDRRTIRDYQTALQMVNAHARFTWTLAHGAQDVRLSEPAELTAGAGVALRLMPSTLHVRGSTLSGSLTMLARAPSMPRLDLALDSFTVQPGALSGALALKGRLSVGPLQGGVIDAHATIETRDGVMRVALQRCAAVKLAGYMAKKGPLFSDLSGTLCAADGKPLFTLSRTGWTLQGHATSISTALPSSGLQISQGHAELSVAGVRTPQSGLIHLAAVVSDAGKRRRFEPEKISGAVTISGTTAHAKLALGAGPQATPIGTITAVQHLDSGRGTAELDFPAITFTPQGLQPAQISPMLATLSQADGSAAFSGHVAWTAKHITSGGRLDVDHLRFSSPLGKAQSLSTHMDFTSLVPPKTAPNQRIAIARVDWVQPLTQTTTQVTLDPNQLRITDTRTELAGGEIAITPFDVAFKPGTTIHGTVQISHLALGKLIAASNLGEKLKLEGSVTGSLPFTFGPQGLHFANGHIEADGPGSLSINHTLWGKGETNSVEKAAYQALENLSYQSLSATVQSVPGGRLRLLFRVVGYDDSTGTSHAEFTLSDLLTGKAFQKQIPIPRGTAVNLTLDISLNFDELLRGYQATWSQLKALNGASQ